MSDRLAEPRLPVAQLTLTDRQDQIVALAAEGLTNHEIGAALGISVKTVESLLVKAYDRLGAENRAQAVALAPRPTRHVCSCHRLCELLLRERFGEGETTE